VEGAPFVTRFCSKEMSKSSKGEEDHQVRLSPLLYVDEGCSTEERENFCHTCLQGTRCLIYLAVSWERLIYNKNLYHFVHSVKGYLMLFGQNWRQNRSDWIH